MTENIINIMLPNIILVEITPLDLLSGSTGDEIIKVVMTPAITPIAALIMAPSKTLRLRKRLRKALKRLA
jgi:hypothetical protein